MVSLKQKIEKLAFVGCSMITFTISNWKLSLLMTILHFVWQARRCSVPQEVNGISFIKSFWTNWESNPLPTAWSIIIKAILGEEFIKHTKKTSKKTISRSFININRTKIADYQNITTQIPSLKERRSTTTTISICSWELRIALKFYFLFSSRRDLNRGIVFGEILLKNPRLTPSTIHRWGGWCSGGIPLKDDYFRDCSVSRSENYRPFAWKLSFINPWGWELSLVK